MFRTAITILFSAIGLLVTSGILLADSEDLSRTSSWQPPTYDQVRSDVRAWLNTAIPDEGIRSQGLAKWADNSKTVSAEVLLNRLAFTIAAVDPRGAKLVEHLKHEASPVTDVSWLEEEKTAPLVRDNLRLFYARVLVQQRYFDEALAHFKQLKPAMWLTPRRCCFIRAWRIIACFSKIRDWIRSIGCLSVRKSFPNATRYSPN